MGKVGLSVLGILAFGLLVAFLVGGKHTAKAVSGDQSKIHTASLPEYGVEVVGPSEARFPAMLSKSPSKTSGSDLEALKSSSVFVVNNSQQSIAGLSLKWELFQSDGRSNAHWTTRMPGLKLASDGGSAHFPEDIARSDYRLLSLLDIPNGSKGNVTSNMGGGGVDKAKQLADSTRVRVSVDAVLFADGAFAGQDEKDLFGTVNAELETSNQVFSEMARAVKGDSEALKRLEMWADGQGNEVQTAVRIQSDSNQMARQQHARMVLAMRKKLGDEQTLDRLNAELNKPRITLRRL